MNRHYNALVAIFIITILSFLIFRHFPRHEKPVEPKAQQLKPIAIKARIAIVIDDWGYNLNNVQYLDEIKSPITVAVLPELPYSNRIAETARKNGKQVILHLPLESKANKQPEKGTLYCSMKKEELAKGIKRFLQSVPGALGVNNHQGSKATENAIIMNIILSQLKQENLFFLDSRTTDKSVCAPIAKKLGVRYAKKDVFLDLPPSGLKNEQLRTYIKNQLDKLYKIAVKNGYAVGIGHDRKDTLEVLKNTLPLLEKKGIKIVFVSELAK